MAHSHCSETKTILVVDDDIATRVLITDALREGGYPNTREVKNGFEALESFEREGSDLIISDLNMPGMSGMELLNRIKELNPSIPVIIVTGYPSIDNSVSAMKKGAVDFLTKPFKPDDLLFKVNLYLKENSFLKDEGIACDGTDWKLHEKIRELSTIDVMYDRIENTRGDDDDIFREIVQLALNVTEGQRCLLVLFDEVQDRFYNKIYHTKNVRTLHEEAEARAMTAHLTHLFRQVVQDSKPLLIRSNNDRDHFNALISVPLMIRSKVFALLTVTSEDPTCTFTQKDLSYLLNLTARASLNLENTLLYKSLFGSIMDTFESLIQSVQARDHYTERHSRSVTKFAVETGRAMHLSTYEMESLKISSLLHDIGKIAIPDHVLLKPGQLTNEEYEIIKNHSAIGEGILKSIALFEEERKIVRHHHERWDGRGYPDGLDKEHIPLLARILSVADTFDAMTSDRPYRKGLELSHAVDQLIKNRGSQFDGDIVDVFIGILN